MAGFTEIIGHKSIIEHLKMGISNGKVSHAYILNGQNLSGKMMLAEAFAQTLQCEKGGTEPCGECKSCIQASHHNQPDIIYVRHEKPNVISVDEVREQINNTIDIKPYASPYKVYIVDEAEKMNVQAQNAILKTIEEPPKYAVILLLTTNADLFLPTILSRCVRLDLRAVRDEDIKKCLMEDYKVPDYDANICVAFAQGNVGRAIQLASSEDFNEMRQSVVQLIKRLPDMEVWELIMGVKQLEEYKLTIQEYFDFILIWFRDVLLYKATMEVDQLVFRDEVYDIRKQAEKSSYQGIETILEAVEKARRRLEANVNYELTMELLLLTIKEN